MEPVFFKSADELRKWFEQNHLTHNELLVGFYKKSSGEQTISWSESVDEALCFGWIDGRINSIDDQRYTRRFTPRKPDSIWSNVNIKKANKLISEGRMKPEGLAAFEKRKEHKSGVYHFEKEPEPLDIKLENAFKQHQTAYSYFQEQSPSYKKLAIHWIMSAKKEETQQKRLSILIEASSKGTKI